MISELHELFSFVLSETLSLSLPLLILDFPIIQTMLRSFKKTKELEVFVCLLGFFCAMIYY
jgi:hypothetical protein